MDILYRKIDLVEQLNLSIGTIDNHMVRGSLKYLKIGKSVRFRDEDINEWISKHYPKKKIAKNVTAQDINNIKSAFGGE
jgi:excisionase family DNA binding protein|tara:strand:- start:1053 stop:1289 length:237 start_codon:yes stop_codon:yes gene_type:complete